MGSSGLGRYTWTSEELPCVWQRLEGLRCTWFSSALPCIFLGCLLHPSLRLLTFSSNASQQLQLQLDLGVQIHRCPPKF